MRSAMRTDLRKVTVIRGEWGQAGCVFQITDPPCYEVDPRTRTCTDRLQSFETVVDSGTIKPVSEEELPRMSQWETKMNQGLTNINARPTATPSTTSPIVTSLCLNDQSLDRLVAGLILLEDRLGVVLEPADTAQAAAVDGGIPPPGQFTSVIGYLARQSRGLEYANDLISNMINRLQV